MGLLKKIGKSITDMVWPEYRPEVRKSLGTIGKVILYTTAVGVGLTSLNCKCKDNDDPAPAGPVAALLVTPERSAYANDGSSLVDYDARDSTPVANIRKVTFETYHIDDLATPIDTYEETYNPDNAPDGTLDSMTTKNLVAGTYAIKLTIEDHLGRESTMWVNNLKRGYGVIDGTAGETGDRTGLQDYLESILLDPTGLDYQEYDTNSGAGWDLPFGSSTVYVASFGRDKDGQALEFVPNWENLSPQEQDDLRVHNESSAVLVYAFKGTKTPQEIRADLEYMDINGYDLSMLLPQD